MLANAPLARHVDGRLTRSGPSHPGSERPLVDRRGRDAHLPNEFPGIGILADEHLSEAGLL
eukprot:11190439-Lingulodinium_polyedra.AAC.1